jgi:RecA/RadA recombinase
MKPGPSGMMPSELRSYLERELMPIRDEPRFWLPTGSVLFNLALSGKADRGFPSGKLANLIGDSSSGKTGIALTCFAEAAGLPCFDDHRLVHDDTEYACEFDLTKLFGKKAAERIGPPGVDTDGAPIFSQTLEELEDNINEVLEEGPAIYIVDSLDPLPTVSEIELYETNRKLREKDKDTKSSYDMTRAKYISGMLRRINKTISQTDSIVILISQTREDINPMTFSTKTRAGGRALKFYCTHEIWTAVAGKVKQTVKGKTVQVGITTRIKITKNRITGRERTIDIPFFYSYGIDDVQSCIQWMVEQKFWSRSNQTVNADSLGLKGTIPAIIKAIEEKGLIEDLHEVVEEAWNELEKATEITGRPPKYS